MKAFKLLFLALVLLAGTTAYGDNATINGINYIINTEDSYAEVGINTGISGDVVIPTAVDYYMVYDVKRIADYAFIGNPGLTSIDIPSCVISLGEQCLANCNNLTDITVHWTDLLGITTHNTAFYGLQSSAVTLHVPYGMETTYANTVPWGVFVNIVEYNPQGQCGDNLYWEYDPSTTTLTISGTGDMYNYTDIYYLAPWHDYRTDITGIVIEDGATSIGDYAFYYCTDLASVTIPVGVTSIGYYAFAQCTNLASVTLPEGVTSIGYNAFYFCTGLETVTIPASVETIGNSAFMSCYGLKDMYVYRDSPISVPSNIFNNVNLHNVTLHVPYGKSANYTATPWSNFKTIVEMNPGGQCGANLTWEYNPSTTTLTISGTGDMYNYNNTTSKAPWYEYRENISSVIIQEGVSSIGKYAFYQCTALTSLSIPSTIKTIGDYAFKGASLATITVDGNNAVFDSRENCNAIIETTSNTLIVGGRNTTFPSSVTIIGNGAFAGRAGLTSITIPEGVTTIGENAFSECPDLTEVVLPSTVNTIGRYAFWHSTALESINIPNNVTVIPQCAFTNCALQSITIPESVTSIGAFAFNGCSSLKSVIIPEEVSNFANGVFDGCTSLESATLPSGWTSLNSTTFKGCTSLKSITIPAGVTTIKNSCFEGCTALTSITIPDGVTSIEYKTFKDCSHLSDVYVWMDSPLTGLNTNVFENIASPATLHVPYGKKAVYEAVAPWSSFNIVEMNPGGKCGEHLFWEYDAGTLTISGTGTTMYDYVHYDDVPWFSYAADITSISLPDGLTHIGASAFYGCSNVALTTIDIPTGVTSIGYYAFMWCSSLTTLTIPSGVTRIEAGTFCNCSGLTSLTIPSNVTDAIGERAFQGCAALTSISIPDGVTSIGESAFQSCTNIATVTLNNGLLSIGQSAFEECSHLTFITIPSTVTTISQRAFSYCNSLASVTIPASVTSIGKYAFYSCNTIADMYVSWTDFTGVNIELSAFSSTSVSYLHLPFGAWGIYNVDPWIYICFDVVPTVTAKKDPENDGVYYNTFYHSSRKYLVPANVEAYTAKRSGDKMILTKVAEAGQTLPANTAVILKSTAQQYEMVPSTASPVDVGENDLLGTDVTMDPPANCYVLSGKASDNSVTGVGFYEYSAPNQLGAHKAYLVLSSGSGAPKRFRFVFDGEQTTTDIESPSLQGRSGEASKILRNGQLIIIRNGVEYNANGQMVK